MAKTPPRIDLDCMPPMEWVKEERRRQIAKRGEQNHNPFRWMGTLAEEFGEAAKALNDHVEGKPGDHMTELEYELIQTAAVAVAFVEAIRRAKGTHDVRTSIDRDGIVYLPGNQGTMAPLREEHND